MGQGIARGADVPRETIRAAEYVQLWTDSLAGPQVGYEVIQAY